MMSAMRARTLRLAFELRRPMARWRLAAAAIWSFSPQRIAPATNWQMTSSTWSRYFT